MDAMRNAMRELLKNAKANAFENPAHPCPWFQPTHMILNRFMLQILMLFIEPELAC